LIIFATNPDMGTPRGAAQKREDVAASAVEARVLAAISQMLRRSSVLLQAGSLGGT